MEAVKKFFLVSGLSFLLYILPGCTGGYYVTTGVHYVNPVWAPPYYEGVRYYYLPDIEVYYDLSNQEFVYLDNGQWLFAPSLPPLYAGYDLYGGFTIALDRSVYQPWMHHQYYVAHYPRYYYRTVYRDQDVATIRGFNENERKPLYWKEEDRKRMNDERINDQKRNDEHVTEQKRNDQPVDETKKINEEQKRNDQKMEDQKRNDQHIDEMKRSTDEQKRNDQKIDEQKKINDQHINDKPENKTTNPRKTQQPNYYGKKIGQPVKVKPQMRENKKKKNQDDHHS